MTTFIAVCLGILTVVHVVVLCVLIAALLSLRKAAQAVEALAYRVHDQVSRVEAAAHKVKDFSGWMRSGWSKMMAVSLGAAAAAWVRRKGAPKSDGD